MKVKLFKKLTLKKNKIVIIYKSLINCSERNFNFYLNKKKVKNFCKHYNIVFLYFFIHKILELCNTLKKKKA